MIGSMASGIFLGIGSNLGDRKQNLDQAKGLLSLNILRSSSLYETEPVGYLDQSWFYNAVIQIEGGLTAHELLHRCQYVERRMGRKRDIPKGPRVIDIDILFFGNVILNEPDLILPHPAIAERRFVLEPMNEIASNFVHPILNKTIHQLLLECPDTSVVKKL
jgi:2-amino-4-hydroxy-6-hydroxymethyldihydropteridine diphosphokinase